MIGRGVLLKIDCPAQLATNPLLAARLFFEALNIFLVYNFSANYVNEKNSVSVNKTAVTINF